MILFTIAAKLKSRSKDDFKGRHFETRLIMQAPGPDPVSRPALEIADICRRHAAAVNAKLGCPLFVALGVTRGGG